MLYATTRSNFETGTAQRALREVRGPDGGFYVPMALPFYTPEQIDALRDVSCAGAVAQVMNAFFSCRLTERDVEFVLGKQIAKLSSISHRITVAECWHNREGDFSRVVRLLTERISTGPDTPSVGEWAGVAVRTALLFGLYGELLRRGEAEPGRMIDVAVLAGDFTAPMAAWYARAMGLPIGNIVCCCNDNGAVWDLLQRGEVKTNQPVRHTATPKCDNALPAGLERLVYATLGREEALRYSQVCAQGGVYVLNPAQHPLVRQGLQAAVVGGNRLNRVIANVYATSGYVLCPYSALVYTGLMDYRAMSGENGRALVISESSPLQCQEQIAQAMGVTTAEVHERLGVV